MLKYAEIEELYECLAYLYDNIVNNATIPKLFNISFLKPLIKDSTKSSMYINNLRPLSISDVYPAIYEQLILGEIRKQFKDHDKQLGFKAKSSCNHAVFILNETMKLNQKLGNHTYTISIDASKAFDRVVREKLWLLLLELNINPALMLSLRNYYKHFYIIIQNDQEFSKLIETSEGVKQGGNASPDMYKIYTNPIVVILSSKPYGITIGDMIVDLIMYADDMVTISNNIDC